MVVEPGPAGCSDQLPGDGLAWQGVVQLDRACRSPDQAAVATTDTRTHHGTAECLQAPLGHVLANSR